MCKYVVHDSILIECNNFLSQLTTPPGILCLQFLGKLVKNPKYKIVIDDMGLIMEKYLVIVKKKKTSQVIKKFWTSVVKKENRFVEKYSFISANKISKTIKLGIQQDQLVYFGVAYNSNAPLIYSDIFRSSQFALMVIFRPTLSLQNISDVKNT